MSHDIDIILDSEWEKTEKKKKRKRKRKRKESTHLSNNENSGEGTCMPSADVENGHSAVPPDSLNPQEISTLTDKHVSMETGAINNASGNHRAGFDAFMTGFSMATFLHRFGKNPQLPLAEKLPDFVNKLNLSGKNVPLKITKSEYAKTSSAHREMWKKVMSR